MTASKLDRTHDASARGWLASANDADTDFPLQNLPFGVFRRTDGRGSPRGGVAIGDQVLDLQALGEAGCLDGQALEAARAAAGPSLNALLSLGPQAWRALRHALFDLLHADAAAIAPKKVASARECLVPLSDITLELPVRIGDYTDFYTSIHHARNIMRLLDPRGEVSPNFQWIPCAYHGRVSSIGVSGQRFHRPNGQFVPAGASVPVYGACQRLDYELELGIYIGVGNAQGRRIPLADAEEHVFGISLLNDWSARDIQAWEMAPLGPFHAKNFATTLSPWIVTMDALAPFRTPWDRPSTDPQPLPYLEGEDHRRGGGLDIQLEVRLETQRMRAERISPQAISRTSFSHHYWSIAQMVTHHAAGGCNLQSGDLLGSGTISGPAPAEAGALMELSRAGRMPVRLHNGEERGFLEDGDAVIFHGWCQRDGFQRIGFGLNRGQVLPALAHDI